MEYDIMSAYQIYKVQMKCYYLCTSLFIARGEIDTTIRVACLSEAIKVISQSGIKYLKRSWTV